MGSLSKRSWMPGWAWYAVPGAALLLILWGLLAIYSTTHGVAAEHLSPILRANFERQLLWFVLALLLVGFVFLLPEEAYYQLAYPIYGVTLLLVAATVLWGREVNGAKSWLYFGPVGIQPGEFMKIGTLLAMARYLSGLRQRNTFVSFARLRPRAHWLQRYYPLMGRLRDGMLPVLLVLAPVILLIAQNDTGTALVFLILIPALLFGSGLSLGVTVSMIIPVLVLYLGLLDLRIATGVAIGGALLVGMLERDRRLVFFGVLFNGTALAGVFALPYLLKPHQVARLEAFVNPELDPRGAGWNVLQAQMAIGSGGIWGKGFLQGAHTQAGFVPAQSTDFILSVIGEEFGLVGTLSVLALYAVLLLGLLHMVERGGWFTRLVGIGVVSLLLVHIVINVGMNTGLMPVIGVPLPFVSYGGSALLTNMFLVALIMRLYREHQQRLRFRQL
ncbi:MAG: rod shape-determining protein RodA [Bacteroidetes bacterium]|nr:rod shape-determining protein RodA [Rhodothermia bacterium]MCX7907672.1 rod shape-determining protein RodA [Bacteroidota bacterium]MDW8286348.1 FtsW/RodA/SpoVE family cell cycle protein [Bacteroidota bacterium]